MGREFWKMGITDIKHENFEETFPLRQIAFLIIVLYWGKQHENVENNSGFPLDTWGLFMNLNLFLKCI